MRHAFVAAFGGELGGQVHGLRGEGGEQGGEEGGEADQRDQAAADPGAGRHVLVADLDERRHPFHVAIENWEHDFNIGTVVRTANAFLAAEVHIIRSIVRTIPRLIEMRVGSDEAPAGDAAVDRFRELGDLIAQTLMKGFELYSGGGPQTAPAQAERPVVVAPPALVESATRAGLLAQHRSAQRSLTTITTNVPASFKEAEAPYNRYFLAEPGLHVGVRF